MKITILLLPVIFLAAVANAKADQFDLSCTGSLNGKPAGNEPAFELALDTTRGAWRETDTMDVGTLAITSSEFIGQLTKPIAGNPQIRIAHMWKLERQDGAMSRNVVLVDSFGNETPAMAFEGKCELRPFLGIPPAKF